VSPLQPEIATKGTNTKAHAPVFYEAGLFMAALRGGMAAGCDPMAPRSTRETNLLIIFSNFIKNLSMSHQT
jgi:hypothetical protein